MASDSISSEWDEWLYQYQDDWFAGQLGDKTYVKPEALLFREDGIYLFVNDLLIRIDGIHCDAHGYYFCQEGWFCWTCCKRDTWNSNSWNTCQNCYHPKCR